MNSRPHQLASDQLQRDLALDPSRSCLVQAPAGSGKTTLLTERFLRLLAEVDEPGWIVAITFTRAAAAEMRHRILDELQRPDPSPVAQRALQHSQALGWNLLDLPAQLRISTIDSFCREIALQQPILSGLGGGLDVREEPAELYRRAARRTLEEIENSEGSLRSAIELLLLARDNNWQNTEDLLVKMLRERDRWMHGFVLECEPDWSELRERLEQPFLRAIHAALSDLSSLLDQIPDIRNQVLELARFACEEPGPKSPWSLAECAEIPCAPFADDLGLTLDAYCAVACFLQTQEGNWRSEKGLNKTNGFPATARGNAGKARFGALITALRGVPDFEAALASLQNLPPARYTDDEWETVRASFILLRHAAAHLQVVFAESASADFIEVAQLAHRVLREADGQPTEAAINLADNIHHLLVDEFQDTSRRQHQMLASLLAAWPGDPGRTCFTVGDPMQSIYFFRGADAELFPRVAQFGIEIAGSEPFPLEPVSLSANFRTQPGLVTQLNGIFEKVFAQDDGSGIAFSHAEPARSPRQSAIDFQFHTNFIVPAHEIEQASQYASQAEESALDAQTREITELIQSHLPRMEQARLRGEKYRVAILGRARKALEPVALALHEAAIPFRAVNLEPLKDRPEVLDALNLARALSNAYDRVAWLGVLRAPWCGLTLADLHTLAATDSSSATAHAMPELLLERLSLLGPESRHAVTRVLQAVELAQALRSQQPTSALGTWLKQVWLRLGGADCVNATANANLELLWQRLDGLPAGRQDLTGPALDSALAKLTALPDPAAGSDCGVQLMTVHNSKGLEFEVVIVPDLQAKAGGRGQRSMLSWLERGLPEPDASGEITEFLIAPLPRKGSDKGRAKAWVDRMCRQREMQEMRRIFYVAATRAREELHLFARPACRRRSDGELRLDPCTNSLLGTAWPALGAEVEARFAEWQAQHEPQSVEAIAASGTENVIEMPAPFAAAASTAKPVFLRRLPADYEPATSRNLASPTAALSLVGSGTETNRLYARHEGGLTSRALGSAVHALLETLAHLRVNLDWPACRAALARSQPAIAAQVRALGLDPAQSTALAARALQIAVDASNDPACQWILSAHPEGASEVSLTSLVSGSVRTVRVDRIFQAGSSPASTGRDCWWIIDYKTAHANSVDPVIALPQLRSLFAPQLEAYATVLRKLHGADTQIRAGLYYPRLLQLDWWSLNA